MNSAVIAAEEGEVVLGRDSFNLGERGKILGVEGVNPPDSIDLHGGDDLQIENVTARDGVSLEQTLQFLRRVTRYGQDREKGPQHGDGCQSIRRRAGLGNAPGIRDRGIKLAKYLQGHIKRRWRISRRFQ